MSVTEMLQKPQRRLNPYRGLVVDVDTWKAAHDYHRDQRSAHVMAMHLPGVAVGLDVVAWHPPDKSVVIYPGVAVDSDGNTFVVGESQRFQLKTKDAGTAYLTLRYREVPQEMTQAPGEEEPQPAYILEAYVLEDRRQVPGPDEIELARIDISGSDNPISDASNPQSPGQDEIDLRFRSVSGPRQLGDVAIGVLPLESGPDGVIRHLPGSASLVRAINATTSYRARFKGVVSLSEDITDCDLLVVAGKAELSLTDDWVSVLRRFLDRGGVLMGERCAGAGKGSGEPFQRSFLGLVDRLGESLSVPDRQHPLMNICHTFAAPPEGVSGAARLVTGEGVVYSDGDYGCLWDGAGPAETGRESIRSAVELGTNLGVYSSHRVSSRSLRLAAS